jgi:hypothetical protein
MTGAVGLGSAAIAQAAQHLLALSGSQNQSAGAIVAAGSSSPNGAKSTASISGPGQLLSNLQQLQAQNPTKFKQLANQIANQLHVAAQQQGQTGQGQFLANLASKFQIVASTGSLSALQQGHHAHHGHHTYNSAGKSVLSSGSSGDVQQLFASISSEVSQALGS